MPLNLYILFLLLFPLSEDLKRLVYSEAVLHQIEHFKFIFGDILQA